MRRLATLLLLGLIPLSGCSDGDSGRKSGGPADGTGTTIPSTAAEAAPGTTPPETSSTTPAPTTSNTAPAPETTPVSENDLVTFIAASEAALEGTRYEGAVYETPEIYIALAQAACTRFSAGDGLEQVVADLLADLGGTGHEDDERLAGAILGAATRTICTEHSDKL